MADVSMRLGDGTAIVVRAGREARRFPGKLEHRIFHNVNMPADLP
jgi:hypothetical protein